MAFIEAGKINEVPTGTMKSFTVDGKDILVVNYNGKLYAMAGKCTHMGGELAKGKLEGKIVTCPRHGSQFDVTTGASLRGPKITFIQLHTKDEPVYEVKGEGESIMVNITF
jgi:3-phenylpropionate/trans-cinnamate dioxygenase ferredoxin component